MAGKPNRTSRIARLAGLAITVAGMAFATASWASITSSENPSTDGSYTISWSAVPNAHSYQLYENHKLVYDYTGTSWSVSGKAAGDYKYTVGYCEYIFDEEVCFGTGYALTVTVSSAPPPPTVRASFSKSSITLGNSATLSWSSENATACSGSPSIGSTATSGSKTYTPSSTGSFAVTVTCTGAGGSAEDSDSVTVNPVPPPSPTVRASFSRSSIILGDSATLSWSSENATACSGSLSIGSTATSGSKTYTPSSTGSFEVTVTCTGAGGSAEDSGSVTVNPAPPPPPPPPPPPTVSASLNKSSITLGGSVRLTWSSENATSCSGSPSIGSTATSSSKTYTPSSAGSFSVTVTCRGAGGSADDSDSVIVEPSAPTLTVPSTDADGSYTVSWTSVSGATIYKLDQKSGSGSFGNVYSGSSTSRNMTGKTPAIYAYRVRACAGSSNCGGWSSTKTTKVPPGVPTLTVPSTDADGSYTLSWTRPSGAASYKLQEKSGSGSFGDIYTGSSTLRNITGKTDGTYSYRARACAGTGNCGGWSSTESVEVSVNNAPVAVNDAARTPFVTAVVISVLDNDTDADGDDLTVTAVTAPASGTAAVTRDDDGNDTQVTYTRSVRISVSGPFCAGPDRS
ncbi:MAG: Ig-like domain-containing protein, partial [Gammaproteobacteria bacterium]|nr:Ig-like domain-containing protein [Gammaproteobacteria bacterium]